MAKLSIVTYPQKILKKRAGEVLGVTTEMQNLVPLMIEAMYESEGIGLAAPQIGVSKRIIIVESAQSPRENKPLDAAQGKPLAFFNPRITKTSEEIKTEEEGCLSLPGIFVPVPRPATIELACQDEQGKEVALEAGGLIARIFQHEVDHLEGKLIVDHLSFMKRFKLRWQLKRIAKQTA